MTRARVLREADAVIQPWRNGRGVTREIAIAPDDADFATGRFDWRISRASIVEDGPFSSFPDHDRILVVLDGESIAIDHGDGAPATILRPLVPYSFRGDRPTHARLLGGPVSDFNVFVARGRFDAQVEVIRGETRRVAIGNEITLRGVVAGPLIVEIEAHAPISLASFETLRIDGSPRDVALRINGHGIALLVRIREVALGANRTATPRK